MKLNTDRALLIIVLILACFAAKDRIAEYQMASDDKMTDVSERVLLNMEMVYRGAKPIGVNSVQSMAITDNYFVVAGRPFGPKELGGEKNNRLIIIDRNSLQDVTSDFLGNSMTFEFGHANGMAFDSTRNRLVIVGIRNSIGECDGYVILDADSFIELERGTLPCVGNGIAYDEINDEFILRDGDMINVVNSSLNRVTYAVEIRSELTKQDIGYFGEKAYLVNWAQHRYEAQAEGLRTGENIIYQADVRNYKEANAFIVKEPRMEMESIDFVDDHEAYVLFNGGGEKYNYFYIYKALFGEHDLE